MAKFGYQLYGVRQMLDADTRAVLRMVADFGYDGVEFSGMYHIPALTFRKYMNEFGLQPCGTHNALSLFKSEESLDRVMEYNYILGNKLIGCHWLEEHERLSRENWERCAEILGRAAETLKKNGFELYYHNHHFEFEEVYDGQRALEIVLGGVPAELLKMELHIDALPRYGLDVPEYIHGLGHRMTMLHVPVLDEQGQVKAEQKTLDAAKKYACEWYILEQPVPDQPQCTSLKRGLEILRSMVNGSQG